MSIVFETHSTSTDNERGIASGWLDAPLSPFGMSQAAELGKRYAGRRFDAVYSSDLERAAMTAEIAFGRPPVRDRRLREWHYGDWSGMASADVDAAKARFIVEPFPGGESLMDVVARVGQFILEVPAGAEKVLIVGHRGTWFALEHLLRGRDFEEILSEPWSWQPGWEYDAETRFRQ